MSKVINFSVVLLLLPIILRAQELQHYEQIVRHCEQSLSGSLSDAEQEEIQQVYVITGLKLGWEYTKGAIGRYKDARAIYDKITSYANPEQKSIVVYRRALAWYLEGLHLQESQQYEEALACLKNARNGFHESGKGEFEFHSLQHIGTVHKFLYEYQDALKAFCLAELLAGDDGQRMEMLAEQRKLYMAIGDSDNWADVSARMEQLALSTENSRLRFSYNAFRGNQAMEVGNYKMAERWFVQNETLLGPISEVSFRHQCYVNLRDLYSRSGNWEQAIRYAHLAKSEFQRVYSDSKATYYLPYGHLADIYRRQGDSTHCFQYLDSLFCAIPLTQEPRELQHVYMSRAAAYAGFGHYDRALADYRTADQLLAARYENSDGGRIALLALMGGMEHRLGDYEESERLYGEYADRIKQLYGEKSRDYIDALGYWANAAAFAGHMDDAILDYSEAVQLLRYLIRDQWPYLTSSEREGYWVSASELFQNMTPFALQAKLLHTSFTATCYNGLILTKSFLLASEQSTYDLVKNHGAENDLQAYASIQKLHEKIRTWERKESEYSDSILIATSAISRLETSLAKRCRTFGDVTAFMDVDYARVKDALGENEVLLDFTDFESQSRGRIYAVYIVDNKHDYPQLKELFQEQAIDSLRVRYPYQYYSSRTAECIYSLLWKPLKEQVPEGATVYYVPTQFLFQIAPESIPVGDGTLLGDHYHFIRLSSAREIVKYDAEIHYANSGGNAKAILYGGLEYSLDSDIMAQEAKKHEVPRMLAFLGEDERVRGDSLFYDLPGSKVEIDAIGQELKAARFSIIPYSGREGTEESFLGMSGKAPLILHMATHGFYYTTDAAEKVDYLKGYSDAMSLSGLVLAGGNAAWQGQELPKGVLGGILSAAEIARMDLSGAELVVLSACHSGRGETTPEGLYGLQRAFKKAGVKTIVMSLWAESDVIGPEFMKAFYKNLTGEANWNKRKAFELAQKAIRYKYPDSPSYWAGFVMLD